MIKPRLSAVPYPCEFDEPLRAGGFCATFWHVTRNLRNGLRTSGLLNDKFKGAILSCEMRCN